METHAVNKVAGPWKPHPNVMYAWIRESPGHSPAALITMWFGKWEVQFPAFTKRTGITLDTVDAAKDYADKILRLNKVTLMVNKNEWILV